MAESKVVMTGQPWFEGRMIDVSDKIRSIEGVRSITVEVKTDETGGFLVDAKIETDTSLYPFASIALNAARTLMSGIAAGKRALVIREPQVDGGTGIATFIVFNEIGRWNRAPASFADKGVAPSILPILKKAYLANPLMRGNYPDVIEEAAKLFKGDAALLSEAHAESARLEKMGKDLGQRCFVSARNREFLRDVFAQITATPEA